MRRRFLTSPAATRVAFGVVIVFVTAQMAWWVYFQATYVAEVSSDKVASLEREAVALDQLLAAGAGARVQELLAEQPQLRLNASGTAVEVDEEALEAFRREHRSVVRMFAFEGPFFVLVVMAGLFIIARNFRLERDLKRRQRNFLDAIGHEYRTPISTLRLLIETAQLRELEPQQLQRYLASMSTEVDRLEQTGRQVLATARLEAGSVQEPRPLNDLVTLVREVLSRESAVTITRGADLDVRLSADPLHVRATEVEMALVLENLLDNAVKHASLPSRRVTVRLVGAGRWASLSVEDDGEGIPASERESVFERFYRAGDELTRQAPGLGLGLYLVRRTVEELGGRVRLEAGAAGGARVTVLLPLETAAVTQRRAAQAGV